MSFCASAFSNSKESIIADTGEPGHYLKADAQNDIAIRSVAPIQVKQLNSQILKSAKGCRLVLSTLPEGSIESHILPGLAHSFLI